MGKFENIIMLGEDFLKSLTTIRCKNIERKRIIGTG